MCTEPLYAIRLKTQYDDKFKRFGKRSPLIVLKAVRDIGKDTSKLNYNREVYDLLMISCGQCMQCRLLRVKQRAVMAICESLDHKENSFITLTFGYPQTYSYYRHPPDGSHRKPLSHYLACKKAHFHEWSLDVETYQKFMKRLRNWYYNYQLANHLISLGRSDLVPSTYPLVTHIRLPLLERPFLLKDFKPKKIRCMHCGEYGDLRQRPHHHSILFGFQFPDIKPIFENGQEYFTSEILSWLWPFGIHRIGKCEYNSCAYVSRYVTKKMNGINADEYYNGRKPEYVTYSTKPVLGSNYFLKNYKEFVNTQVVSVVADKKYECRIPKSYDNILKKLDLSLYNDMKEKRVKDCLTDLDKLFKQKRSIYAKLDSNVKNTMSTLHKLCRSYESSSFVPYNEILKKAKAFGISTKYFVNSLADNVCSYLSNKNYKSHRSRSTNDDLHQKYYKFELARKRHINNCYQLHYSDERVERDVAFYENMPNPFLNVLRKERFDVVDGKVVSKVTITKLKRGRSLPDVESIDNDSIDENWKGVFL